MYVYKYISHTYIYIYVQSKTLPLKHLKEEVRIVGLRLTSPNTFLEDCMATRHWAEFLPSAKWLTILVVTEKHQQKGRTLTNASR